MGDFDKVKRVKSLYFKSLRPNILGVLISESFNQSNPLSNEKKSTNQFFLYIYTFVWLQPTTF